MFSIECVLEQLHYCSNSNKRNVDINTTLCEEEDACMRRRIHAWGSFGYQYNKKLYEDYFPITRYPNDRWKHIINRFVNDSMGFEQVWFERTCGYLVLVWSLGIHKTVCFQRSTCFEWCMYPPPHMTCMHVSSSSYDMLPAINLVWAMYMVLFCDSVGLQFCTFIFPRRDWEWRYVSL